VQATRQVPATQACPLSAGHSLFELHELPLGVLGAPALGWPALPAMPEVPALLEWPAGLWSGTEVLQSSSRHSLFAQPLKAVASKALSPPKLATRAASVRILGVETKPETIRENAKRLTGRTTGLPCPRVLGFVAPKCPLVWFVPLVLLVSPFRVRFVAPSEPRWPA